jgi:hypothetical protein
MRAPRLPTDAAVGPPPGPSLLTATTLGALLHEARYLDDDLLDGRRGLADLHRMTAAWRGEAVARLARDSARVLARLGGSEPDMEPAPWRP